MNKRLQFTFLKTNFKTKLLSSQKGFSLIQVMIVGGLLASLSLAGMKVMTQQIKAGRKLDADADLRQVQSMIIGLLNRKKSCEYALGGLNKGDELRSLKFDENSSALIEVDDRIGNSGFEVKSIKILTDQEAQDAKRQVSQNIIHIRVGLHQTKNLSGGRDKFVYFSISGDVGMVAIFEGPTESGVRVECENVAGWLEDDEVIVENTNGGLARYTGICHYPEGEMILSCGI